MRLLIECSARVDANTYSQLMLVSLGKGWKKILELSITFFGWGCTLGYEISFAMFMVNNLAMLGVKDLFI
jgi:hypothetical protein